MSRPYVSAESGITDSDVASVAQMRKKEDEKTGDDFYDTPVHFRGVFVDVLKAYEGKPIPLRISSFTHKNVTCHVLSVNSRYVVLRKSIDKKKLILSQSSIKDVEEV